MEICLASRGLQSFDPSAFSDSPEHVEVLLQIARLDLSHNSLLHLNGLAGLVHLVRLDLSHNGLRSLTGGLPLTLQELDVSHNSIASLQNAALLPLTSLVQLNLSFNELVDLRGLPGPLGHLSQLDVRGNQISTLKGLEQCAALQEIHAEANLIRDVDDVASLKYLLSLRRLYLASNPLLLRKRLLHSLQFLLPPGLEDDDLPATAPPSSLHSSANTTALPSAPNTTLPSLESSIALTDQSAHHDGGVRSSRDNPALLYPRRATAPFIVCSPQPPSSSSSPPRESTQDHGYALRNPSASSGVVGGEEESPTCRRRALPRENTLNPPAPPSQDGRRRSPFEQRKTEAPATAALNHQVYHSRQVLLAETAPLPSPSALVACATTVTPPKRRGQAREVAVLEEQLIRVMKERDVYKAEVQQLRTALVEMEQRCAEQGDKLKLLAGNGVAAAATHAHHSPTSENWSKRSYSTPNGGKQEQLSYRHYSDYANSSAQSDTVNHRSVEDKKKAQESSSCSVEQPQPLLLSSAESSQRVELTGHQSDAATTAGPVRKASVDRRQVAALLMSKLQKSSQIL